MEGKSEGRGLSRRERGGTTRSVGANFHFFHLFAPLTEVLKKRHGGTGSRLVDFRPVCSFIGSLPSFRALHPILSEFSFSLSFPYSPPVLSFSLPPSLSLSLTSVILFARSSRILSPFLGLSPPDRTTSPSSNPLDTSGHGRSPYVTDTIPLE